ncbi:hypothetical protein GCM10027294_47880 [Marinactinospora endophytica]
MPRTPNTRLASLLAEAELTYDALARAVNRVGAEAGLDLRYDRTSVAHWLSGVRPRGQVPNAIAEALARQLRRPLTPTDTGFAVPPSLDEIGLNWRGDVVASLAELGRAEMDVSRRTVLRHSVYSLAALVAIPNWQEIADRSQHAPKATLGRVGPGEIEAVSTMAEAFSTLDDKFGGGHARAAMAAYITNDLTRWLRADASPENRARLHAAAAEFLYLAGFMAWDDEAHGLAERYYLQALGLAAEAGDPLTYATVLRGMSIQASALGHHGEALHLVEAAESAAKSAAQPRMRAFLAGQRAVAQAALGDRRSAVASLGEAERDLESATSPAETFGSYHHAAFSFQEAHLRAHLGDVDGAVKAMTVSNRCRPAQERRSRALSTALLGDYRFRAGHLEAACQTWHDFLDDYPYLSSGRADTALGRIRRSVKRHPGNAAAAALSRRMDGLV